MSQHDIPYNPDLLFIFLGFCSISINGFIFPSGTLSPTLLDVAAITGLPISRNKIPSLHHLPCNALNIQFGKITAPYSNFISGNFKVRGNVSDIKHQAFILLWLCKFFLCTNLVAVVIEYSYYVIILGNCLALGSLFFSVL